MICEAVTNTGMGGTGELRIPIRVLKPSNDYKERHGHNRDFEADVSRSNAELKLCASHPATFLMATQDLFAPVIFYYIDPFAIHVIRSSISVYNTLDIMNPIAYT